jgi:hypothetical protein
MWVIFDRFSRFCLPKHVRFAPKATGVLHCRKMMRWARSGSSLAGPRRTDRRPSRSLNRGSSLLESGRQVGCGFRPSWARGRHPGRSGGHQTIWRSLLHPRTPLTSTESGADTDSVSPVSAASATPCGRTAETSATSPSTSRCAATVFAAGGLGRGLCVRLTSGAISRRAATLCWIDLLPSPECATAESRE